MINPKILSGIDFKNNFFISSIPKMYSQFVSNLRIPEPHFPLRIILKITSLKILKFQALKSLIFKNSSDSLIKNYQYLKGKFENNHHYLFHRDHSYQLLMFHIEGMVLKSFKFLAIKNNSSYQTPQAFLAKDRKNFEISGRQ